ncbi:MAG TPA: phosphate ABC transporter permease PstA [Acidimicrobiales bacterium]|nr:phosphate ABC transporter permease PstA [Acidimicrobiales bacterium]
MALTSIGASGEAAVQAQVAAALRGRRTEVRGRVFEVGLLVALLVSLLILGVLLSRIVIDGWPVYTDRGWRFLDGSLSGNADRAGISQGIVGSFWIAICVIVVAFPLGVGAAIYLEEYAPRNRLTSFIELNIRNLAGVPSVVYGLLGLAIFVNAFGGFAGASGVDRRTLVAAGITLAVLVLPIVIITSSEAIRSVPQSLREGAYGVGATRWEVIRSEVLPYAAPGILTGALLSIARAVGEAAPLIVVGAVTGFFSRGGGLNVGNVVDPSHLTDRFVALPSIVTTFAKQPDEAFRVENASATIMAMLVFVLLVNSIAIVLRNRFEKKRSQ